MNTRRKRRLVAAACVLVLLAAPSIWFARQYRQMTLNHALIAAIKESNVGRVDYLLTAGADANKAGPSGQTPLMLACSCGGTETARILLDHGANPNPKSLLPGNITPLMLAKQDGDTEMVRLLKAHGAKK